MVVFDGSGVSLLLGVMVFVGVGVRVDVFVGVGVGVVVFVTVFDKLNETVGVFVGELVIDGVGVFEGLGVSV